MKKFFVLVAIAGPAKDFAISFLAAFWSAYGNTTHSTAWAVTAMLLFVAAAVEFFALCALDSKQKKLRQKQQRQQLSNSSNPRVVNTAFGPKSIFTIPPEK